MVAAIRQQPTVRRRALVVDDSKIARNVLSGALLVFGAAMLWWLRPAMGELASEASIYLGIILVMGMLSALVRGSRLIVLGAMALWFHYGSQVFFEMIRTGLSACF